jgi:alkylhydroperoxidase family enzyme
MRHAAAIEALRAAVLEGAGALEPETRRAIFSGGGPEALQPYLEKVRRHAYRVTDADVEALRAGWSDDELFEATVAAALGQGLRRLG